jgi:hypothetical protein
MQQLREYTVIPEKCLPAVKISMEKAPMKPHRASCALRRFSAACGKEDTEKNGQRV